MDDVTPVPDVVEITDSTLDTVEPIVKPSLPVDPIDLWISKIGICGLVEIETNDPYARMVSSLCNYTYQAVGFYYTLVDERGCRHALRLFNSYDGLTPTFITDGDSCMRSLMENPIIRSIEIQRYNGCSQEFISSILHVSSQNLRSNSERNILPREEFHKQCWLRASGLSHKHTTTGRHITERVLAVLRRGKICPDSLFGEKQRWVQAYAPIVGDNPASRKDTFADRKQDYYHLMNTLVDVMYSDDGRRLDLASKFASSLTSTGNGGLSLAKSSLLEQLVIAQSTLLQQLVNAKESTYLHIPDLIKHTNKLTSITKKLGYRTDEKLCKIEDDGTDKLWFLTHEDAEVGDRPKGEVLLDTISNTVAEILEGRDLDAVTLVNSFNDVARGTTVKPLVLPKVPVTHCLVRGADADKVYGDTQQRFHLTVTKDLRLHEINHLSNDELHDLSHYLDSLNDERWNSAISTIVDLLTHRSENIREELPF